MPSRWIGFFLSASLWLSSISMADSLDDYIESEMVRRGIPGVSIAVIQDGRVLRATGYGLANIDSQAKVKTETLFEIGSISKQFTAQAIMLLVEQQKLDLSKSIAQVLPANAPESWREITVAHLLSQSSGIKDWTELGSFSYRSDYSKEEFIDLVKSFPLDFVPSEKWKYSNTNAPLLGMIIERVAERPFEDFVVDNVIRPLELPSIRYKHSNEFDPKKAVGYVLGEGGMKIGEPHRPKVIAPSGGVISNAVDLAKWWDSILKGRLLRPATIARMLQPTLLSNGQRVAHGFGFFTDSFNGHKMIHHHGSTVGGFGSVVRHFPSENITVAVFGNLEDGGFGPDRISKRVADMYIPGSYIGGLKAKRDEQSGSIAKDRLELLKKVVDNQETLRIEKSYALRISDKLKSDIAMRIANMRDFEYLGEELVNSDHFVMDPAITKYEYFRISSEGSPAYVHLRFDREGLLRFMILEE